MTNFTVHLADRADIPQLLQLCQGLWREHAGLDPAFALSPAAVSVHRSWLSKNLRRRDCRVLIAEADGKQIGTATATVSEAPLFWPSRYGYLRDVYVLPPWRRQGLGTLLVKDLLNWLRSESVARVELLALAANTEARAFWSGQDFEDKFFVYHRSL